MPKRHHITFVFLECQPITFKMTNSLTIDVEPFTSYALEIKIYSCIYLPKVFSFFAVTEIINMLNGYNLKAGRFVSHDLHSILFTVTTNLD